MSESHPLVCDLSGAPDSPAERLSAYRRLFTALLDRVSLAAGFRYVFDASRVDRSLLDRLSALEAACCPFLSSAFSTTGHEVWWDVTAATDEAVPFYRALRDLPDALAAAGEDDAAAVVNDGAGWLPHRIIPVAERVFTVQPPPSDASPS